VLPRFSPPSPLSFAAGDFEVIAIERECLDRLPPTGFSASVVVRRRVVGQCRRPSDSPVRGTSLFLFSFFFFFFSSDLLFESDDRAGGQAEAARCAPLFFQFECGFSSDTGERSSSFLPFFFFSLPFFPFLPRGPGMQQEKRPASGSSASAPKTRFPSYPSSPFLISPSLREAKNCADRALPPLSKVPERTEFPPFHTIPLIQA